MQHVLYPNSRHQSDIIMGNVSQSLKNMYNWPHQDKEASLWQDFWGFVNFPPHCSALDGQNDGDLLHARLIYLHLSRLGTDNMHYCKYDVC